MWDSYYLVCSLDDAVELLNQKSGTAKVIAGGTDLMLELKKNLHPDVRTIIDISRVKGLDFIREEGEYIHLGPMVTHNQCLVSDLLLQHAMPLVKAAQSIGAAQIRNTGTIYGNLITASPANDTISPLVAMDTELHVRSLQGEKWVHISDFYQGVRKTVLEKNELIADLRFKKLTKNEQGAFAKYLLRQTHGISVANATIILTIDKHMIHAAKITLGAVAPTIVRASEAEEFLTGKQLSKSIIESACVTAKMAAKPISDVRATETYRNHLIPILVKGALTQILDGSWKEFPQHPVLLWGNHPDDDYYITETVKIDNSSTIQTHINGKQYQINEGQNKSLIKMVRESAGLTGTKLGCGEGECGACTLFFNYLPVLSCLMPTPKAYNADIVTIEGISENEKIHPIQQAFIDEGAVQCGYCTPGFIMSAVKLLEEKPHPMRKEIMEGLAGNICRCTGYNNIIAAVETAAKRMQRTS